MLWTAGLLGTCAIIMAATMSPSQFWRVGSLFCLGLIALAGLHVLTGLARVISLYHVALVGVGAYTAGALSLSVGLCPILSVPAGVLAAAAISFVLAKLAGSLQDHYLTLATLAASEILTNIFRGATGLTGGANGLVGIPPLSIAGLVLFSPQDYFPVCAAFAVGALCVAWALQRSFLGKALRAAGDAGVLVETLGIDSIDLRLAGFVIGGSFAGLAGALAAHVDGFVGPESFGVDRSMAYLCFLVIGGLGKLRSVPVAAALAVIAVEILRGIVGWQMVILACAAVATLYLRSWTMPPLFAWMKRRLGAKAGVA